MYNDYNGWTNRETWLVALWIDNEEWTYHQAREIARHTVNAYALADQLEEWVVSELVPDLGASLASDLLTTSIGRVNWEKIAEHYMADNE